MTASVRAMLMHKRFTVGDRTFVNYFVARAWARHLGIPESEIKPS